MRAYLVDDEPLAVKRLARMLSESASHVEIAGSSNDPARALEDLRREPVDVLFLDIEMPGLTGFELLEKIDPQPFVIFTTAYNQYALEAFRVNSVDYLLKPIEQEGLERALAKLDRMLGARQPPADLRSIVAQVTQALRSQHPAYLGRVASRSGERVEFVDVANVTHFFAQDKLTYAATAAKNHAVDHSITELEQKLDPQRFCRVHRSALVNLDHVRELYTWFGGKLVVRLKDGKTELPVARDRVAELKQRLGM